MTSSHATDAGTSPAVTRTDPHHGPLPALALAAIGIVFGDIGTSPLYTMSTVFDASNGLTLSPANLIGVVSLILWSLLIVVSLKYVTLIMRASNHGEGGIMALLALATSSVANRPRLRHGLLIAGVFGAALFFGDGVITPAISVLSAVEGLEVAAPHLKPYVLPVTLAVLIALFLVQKNGTAGIGTVFGPIMVLWFAVLALIGLVQIFKAPAILAALNPLAGIDFLLLHGWLAFVSLGSVVLALTGAEALYADMGHFGAVPIRISWFGLVFPALGLNYLGQGALLLAEPKTVASPFFHLFPSWALYPMVVLATVATVIASQAVISGAYSMTKQAVQLGFLPRMTVVHTSDREIGQVYVPAINWMLLAAVVISVLGFGSSTALGSAYGIAVTGTMLITTILTFYVVRYAWNYNWLVCVLSTGFFFAIDATFFSANLLKFLEGGWYPLLAGAVIFTAMTTWHRGREMMVKEAGTRAGAVPLRQYLDNLFDHPPLRVGGTAVFPTINPEAVPHALLNNIEHNGVLHDRVIFANVAIHDVPYVAADERLAITPLGHNCFNIIVAYGFKDDINLPAALQGCAAKGLAIDPQKASYFLSHAQVVATGGKGMAVWRERMFAAMSHNIGNVAEYLKLPADRVMELGSRVEI
ncbi:MAG: potassium transporter Kup [Rhodoferax sp.]|nr:potassium transporter Kup [Rhodoferax sp.]